jgi:hypothetical protein
MVVRLSALRTGRLYPQEINLVLISVEAELTPGPYCDWKDYVTEKNPMTPSGIEPATCRFVASCLNHYVTARPIKTIEEVENNK